MHIMTGSNLVYASQYSRIRFGCSLTTAEFKILLVHNSQYRVSIRYRRIFDVSR